MQMKTLSTVSIYFSFIDSIEQHNRNESQLVMDSFFHTTVIPLLLCYLYGMFSHFQLNLLFVFGNKKNRIDFHVESRTPLLCLSLSTIDREYISSSVRKKYSQTTDNSEKLFKAQLDFGLVLQLLSQHSIQYIFPMAHFSESHFPVNTPICFLNNFFFRSPSPVSEAK